MVSETKYETTKGQRLKILTSKQILQILPVVIVQVETKRYFAEFIKWYQANFLLFVLSQIDYQENV